jgi:hypothetical protein
MGSPGHDATSLTTRPFPAHIHPHTTPPRIFMTHARSSTTRTRCHSERFVHRRGAVGGVHSVNFFSQHRSQRDAALRAAIGTDARRCIDSGSCGVSVGPFAEEQLCFRP